MARPKKTPETGVKANVDARIADLKKIIEAYAQREKILHNEIQNVHKMYQARIQYLVDSIGILNTSAHLIKNQPIKETHYDQF